MVSQSRRYNEQLWAYENQISALGRTGVLTTEFFKAPHFGGFRDEMDHPLLLDMAVHQMDSARFLLHSDPVAVYCEEYNPAWSWYRGDAGCTAVYEMASGARYVFTGSWCSPGLETSWNGSWRASGEHGSASWSGDDLPVIERVIDGASKTEELQPICSAMASRDRCGNSFGPCGPAQCRWARCTTTSTASPWCRPPSNLTPAAPESCCTRACPERSTAPSPRNGERTSVWC